MRFSNICLAISLAATASWVSAADYEVTGQAGVMSFVAIDPVSADNPDVYRMAAASLCSRKPVCQVHFWVGSAPNKTPFNDQQLASKRVVWQQNLNTGLRRWLVKCSDSQLFSSERECM